MSEPRDVPKITSESGPETGPDDRAGAPGVGPSATPTDGARTRPAERREVYLDHAATTPVRPSVAEAVTRHLGLTGNPSSLHAAGRAARRVVEESREAVAAALGAHPTEVVLTGGGTEADNLAVKGLYWAQVARDPGRTRVLVSAVEHHAVLDPALWLAERAGAVVVHLPVDADGRVVLDALAGELQAHPGQVALVSVMWANNEVGTVQPVEEVVALAHAAGVPVHVDAVQAVGALPVDLGALGADAVSVSAHKVGGPVGVGALVARRGLDVAPVLHGGGQERGLRSGTVPTALAAGFAAAVAEATHAQRDEAARLAGLRNQLLEGIRRVVPDAVVRGPDPVLEPDARLPGNLLVTLPGCEAEALLMLLDARGIRASSGSACRAGVTEASHVLIAMGADERTARSALRLTLGWTSTTQDVDAVVAALPEVVRTARAAGAAGATGAG